MFEDVGADQVFYEFADSSWTNDLVKAKIDFLVDADGQFFLHGGPSWNYYTYTIRIS